MKGTSFRQFLRELLEIDRLLKYSGNCEQERLHCIGDDSGKFLFLQVLAVKPKNILEIGTSYGYSTVWLASAARIVGSHFISVEKDSEKIERARQIIGRFRLLDSVELINKDAISLIDNLSFEPDFVLIDADKKEYVSYTRKLMNKIKGDCVIYADNVISHRVDLDPFINILDSSQRVYHQIVPIGKGIELCFLRSRRKKNERR
jgi:predicted O-methyltransferase YrrM